MGDNLTPASRVTAGSLGANTHFDWKCVGPATAFCDASASDSELLTSDSGGISESLDRQRKFTETEAAALLTLWHFLGSVPRIAPGLCSAFPRGPGFAVVALGAA